MVTAMCLASTFEHTLEYYENSFALRARTQCTRMLSLMCVRMCVCVATSPRTADVSFDEYRFKCDDEAEGPFLRISSH